MATESGRVEGEVEGKLKGIEGKLKGIEGKLKGRFGETYYLGHEYKTLREVTPEGSGTTVMYQNLILRLLSTEGDVNVTSLKIYDEIENPITITQH